MCLKACLVKTVSINKFPFPEKIRSGSQLIIFGNVLIWKIGHDRGVCVPS